MNLYQLKNLYKERHNINAVNLITDIENLQNKSSLSVNKIIQYMLSNCTSKNNRKILNILASYYPTDTDLSQLDLKAVLNKNHPAENINTEINIQTNKNSEEIKLINYKDIKKKKSKVIKSQIL